MRSAGISSLWKINTIYQITIRLWPPAVCNTLKVGKRKLKSNGSYKFYVRPYQNVNKKKKNIGKSNTAHVLMRASSQYANASSVSVKKRSMKLQKGKTAVIKAKVKVPSGRKQPKNHGAKYVTLHQKVLWQQ